MATFKQIAQQVTLLSPIMLDRDKLETEDIQGRELTVIAFDFAPKFAKDGTPITNPITGEVDTFGVVVFKEHPDKYYCVGAVFTKVCQAWASEYNSAEEASLALEAEGGVRVRFTPSRTKRGNNLTAVEILN